ncbi:uncharacterized protein DEA37_0008217 [Paragonimus westermani]|uniref:Uncharacterized protein n=1 Tax=Paragonimus westermani TaxID=34504 RepID=A0A5J4NVC1_9TREM|nr:uncharacterized protein DEA37_0008217 [Paragonimus westermani]
MHQPAPVTRDRELGRLSLSSSELPVHAYTKIDQGDLWSSTGTNPKGPYHIYGVLSSVRPAALSEIYNGRVAAFHRYLQSVPVIVFINKIDVLDEKIHLGQRINKLYSFAANWLDTYEMRKFCLSSNDSKEQCNSSLHESMLSCYSQASVNLDNAVFQSTNSYFPTSTPLRKIDEDNSVDVVSSELNSSLAIRTQRSPSDKSMQSRSSRMPSQSSFRWRKNSFNRTLSALAPKNSIRRFRRSFRQAAFLPVSATPASCGQTSRLSCTATVARVILEMPYHKFQPSRRGCEFSNARPNISTRSDEKSTRMQGGVDGYDNDDEDNNGDCVCYEDLRQVL